MAGQSLKDWRSRASCKGATSLFFSHECNPRRCRLGCYGDDVEQAKSVCSVCPVFGSCWHWMMSDTNGHNDGVIAGTTKQERIKLRKAIR